MPGPSNYAVWKLDLTTAGKEKISGPWGVVRMISAVDGSATIIPTTLIRVRAGDADEDDFPLRLGQAAMIKTDSFTISWAAQAGITIELGLAENISDVDWDVNPPVSTGTIIGTVATLEKKAATLNDTADKSVAATTQATLLAANTSRRAAIIKNLDANTAASRIGDAPAASQGHELMPGETIVLATTADILGFNTGAGAQSVSLLEVED